VRAVLILAATGSATLLMAAPGSAAPGRDLCGGPPRHWLVPSDGRPEHVVFNRVSPRTRDTVFWNGAEIGRATLLDYLSISQAMNPLPFTILDPGARPDCALVEALRRDIERSGICKVGGCGEAYGRWPDGPPPGPRFGSERERADALAELEAAAEEMEAAAEEMEAAAAAAAPER